jgi:lysophospholipase L1-like esterase
MQAMNGSAFRRTRLIGSVMAIVFALSALAFASTASAKPAPVSKSYLALGDSLAFGYSQQLFNENEKLGEPPSAFENGYVDDYFTLLKPNTNGIQKQDLGCPGETTDSLIGNGPLGSALAASPFKATTESPCAYHKSGLPLHIEYGGEKSQLEKALELIAVDAATGVPVTKLSFNIGANDQLRQVKACEKEVGEEYGKEGKSKYGSTPEGAVKGCLEAHLKSLIEHIVKNVKASIYALRKGSEFGGVDYTGTIIFQLGYDPYGNVSGSGEVLPGSTGLVSLINENVQKNVEEAPYSACTANPFPRFNPQNKAEPKRLQTYTNMANTTEYEGKKNGPDIHPTPAGYNQLAKIMKKSCGI